MTANGTKAKAAQRNQGKVRLLKVVVQAVLVYDDGEQLTEVNTEPTVVTAKDWAGYPDRLAEEITQRAGEIATILDSE